VRACTKRRAQTFALALLVLLERLVDELGQRAGDAAVQEVAGFAAGDRQVRDPLLELPGAGGQLVERQLDRV
jgi:hypothetical protein